MSRAFVKEQDGDSPDDGLPERTASAEPNYVTPEGLEALKRDHEAVKAELARVGTPDDAASKRARAALVRDEKYFASRIESAILIEPSAGGEAQLGSRVTIDDGSRHMTYEIVGEDQADPAAGRVSWTSPLGRALIGKKQGERAVWSRPLGDVEVTVVEVR